MERQEMIDKVWDLRESELVDLWYDYCEANSLYDDMIHTNDEFFFDGFNIIDVAQNVANGDWRYGDDYIKQDGYGHFISFTYKSEIMEHIDLDPFVDWLIDNGIEF